MYNDISLDMITAVMLCVINLFIPYTGYSLISAYNYIKVCYKPLSIYCKLFLKRRCSWNVIFLEYSNLQCKNQLHIPPSGRFYWPSCPLGVPAIYIHCRYISRLCLSKYLFKPHWICWALTSEWMHPAYKICFPK